MPGITHARRKFFEAVKESWSAQEGIKHIRKLYRLEDEVRSENLDDGTFLNERKARAGPLLETFKVCPIKRSEEVPPSLLLGKAVRYSTLNGTRT
jgi:transposase